MPVPSPVEGPVPSKIAASDLNLGALVSAVQNNCDISDAQFAGDLTMCTFLLKMRELYRWEHDLPLSQEMPRDAVGNWLHERELLWESMETAPYEALPLPGGRIDPFESSAINAELTAHGLVYSGGYGRSCKPHFFLGSLVGDQRRDGIRVLVSGCEYARDLDAPPGMLLDDTIFVRTESLRRWLWGKVEEWRWNRRNAALGRAIAGYPFDTDTDLALSAMTGTETESVILHEIGEARANAELGEDWGRMLADLMRTRAEIMARAVRDLYADSLSTLPALLARDEPNAIHFYFANFVGMRRKLFPELATAYEGWVAGGRLDDIRRLAESGRQSWLDQAQELLDLHRRHGAAAGEKIEARYADRVN